MSSIWDEIKNLPDLKPYVYGLKKEYDDRIKKIEEQNEELKSLLKIYVDEDYRKSGEHYMNKKAMELLKER